MRKAGPNNEIRALAIAMAGATLAAVVTMFVPTAILESVTGATGLSELVPAAAAPLGDTARALIAFGSGALTLAVLALLLMRQPSPSKVGAAAPLHDEDDANESGIAAKWRDWFSSVSLPRMPWAKDEDDITDLADLPRLRTGDVHPDAPPRRPLSAGTDLPVLDLAQTEPGPAPQPQYREPVKAEIVTEFVEQMPEPISEFAASVQYPEPMRIVDPQPTLAEMVAQLEKAVAERKRQLEDLERVAAELAPAQAITENEAQSPQEVDGPARPRLEAVSPGIKDDDMDSALEAALATLHRMNRAGG